MTGTFLPDGAATGPISVTTLGGTSAMFQRNLISITASAARGSAKEDGKASANPGQTITLTGTNLTKATAVLFETIDSNGARGEVLVNRSLAATDGASAQVVVPINGVSGLVRVVG
ncbi:MAG: hypothetical protein WCH98_09185, partial [Verrucomicrobiota bacterium]